MRLKKTKHSASLEDLCNVSAFLLRVEGTRPLAGALLAEFGHETARPSAACVEPKGSSEKSEPGSEEAEFPILRRRRGQGRVCRKGGSGRLHLLASLSRFSRAIKFKLHLPGAQTSGCHTLHHRPAHFGYHVRTADVQRLFLGGRGVRAPLPRQLRDPHPCILPAQSLSQLCDRSAPGTDWEQRVGGGLPDGQPCWRWKDSPGRGPQQVGFFDSKTEVCISRSQRLCLTVGIPAQSGGEDVGEHR